ncbi:MAG: hypothetical protein VXW87_02955 [Pseudomonadota bacterium]|nr:hypothetical protein [Pseudomonadota bacterium]
MDHISDAMANSPILRKLKENLSQGGHKSEVLSHLSAIQKQEVVKVTAVSGRYTVWLKSAYALYGIRAALRNFHCPILVKIDRSS